MDGNLIRTGIDGNAAEVLRRVPLGAGVSQGGVSEADLQDFLFRIPQALPVSSIDTAYSGAVSICRELSTPASFIDALYVNDLGRLTLAEFKLWRNPKARREVIGQILDYAKDLAAWSYEDLQRQVSMALGKSGNILFDLVREQYTKLEEAAFVDNVSRHLKRGEFLLLIIGDGIQEGVENIVRFVQHHSGLHFNLALVEAALYRDGLDRLLVQPLVLARTEILQRIVIEGSIDEGPFEEEESAQEEALSDQEEENMRFWVAVLQDYAFSDVTVEVPSPVKDSTIYVRVAASGWNGWALWFGGYLDRKKSVMGCYLTCRKNTREVRIFEELQDKKFGEIQAELGEELEHWQESKRQRIGFRRDMKGDFFIQSEDCEDYRNAISWMRSRLDCLVSGLSPRLQNMLDEVR